MKIHFIGIGGIGVSALAQYYLAAGHQVSGSDLAKSEITDILEKKGVKIVVGEHQAENLTKIARARKFSHLKVIYSAAVQKGNPELKAAREQGIECQSYSEALGELTRKYFTIAVSGTHGKSTVTAMIALILIKAGLNPTVIIGTKLQEFGGSNFREGKSKYLVIEADEWQASFLNYWPKIIVLTNIEREHLDYYKNLEHILKTYREYISHLLKDGALVVNGNDQNIKTSIQDFVNTTNPTAVENVVQFSAGQKEARKLREILKVPGEHNVLNALAALTAARVLKIPDEISFRALSDYRGSWRRFEEKKIMINHLPTIIISDYGHHPTEIAVTLKAAREKYPQKEIWCCFQPHQYQRTFYLLDEFVKVFREMVVRQTGKPICDKMFITDIFDVAGRENKEIRQRISAEKLVRQTASPDHVLYLPQEKIVGYLKKHLKGGEVVIMMGAGSIYNFIDLLLSP